MASLIAKPAFDGLLPIRSGGLCLSETTYDAITWIAPFRGKADAVAKALTKQIGAGLPEPNRVTGTDTRAVWTGPAQALVLGAPLKPLKGAAMSDQSGAWASCALSGPHAAEVLARLLPIDLRADAFQVGHCARTLLGHMTCVVMRVEVLRYEVMVFRSMATTAAHEIGRAMQMVAAREALMG